MGMCQNAPPLRRLPRNLELHLCFSHTEFYISYPDLYLEWLCYYWAIAAKSRETRISLLLMLFPELKPNWATISMKTARLHRTLLTNTVTASLEKLTGIGLCSQ